MKTSLLTVAALLAAPAAQAHAQATGHMHSSDMAIWLLAACAAVVVVRILRKG